ncbi:hypothetical protein GCM10009112_21980 [Marinomonas arenicola]|uniref:hypothetical protein n=1 Tax=Marinomonas TaxID=28253 RepID=UPI0010556BA5|nr:hypothetical protein [Marinomonas sp. KMM3893]
MKYFVGVNVKTELGIENHKFELTHDEVLGVKNARDGLVRILDLECIYDQIVECLIEFKTSLYKFNLKSAHGSSSLAFDYKHMHEMRSELNRRAFNLLNFGKLYLDKHFRANKKNDESSTSIDHRTSFLARVCGNKDYLDIVESSYLKEYEDNNEYALACILRNLSQHTALPINTISRESSRKDGSVFSIFSVPMNKFKIKVKKSKDRKVLERFSDVVDLHLVLDGYVHAIGKFHEQNRRLVNVNEKINVGVIGDLVGAIDRKYPGRCFPLFLCESNRLEGFNEVFSLSLDWFDTVLHLREKNRRTVNWNEFEFSEYSLKEN